MIVTLRHEVPHYSRRSSNRFHLNMHGGASIIHIAETSRLAKQQKGPPKTVYDIYLWAVEDTDLPVERRDFRFVQDGERLEWMGDDVAWRHIATFCSLSGHIWQHVYETTGLAVDEVQTGPRLIRLRAHAEPESSAQDDQRHAETPARLSRSAASRPPPACTSSTGTRWVCSSGSA